MTDGMTYGQVARNRFLIAALALTALLLFNLPADGARRPGSPAVLSVTLLTVSAQTVQVQGEDGRALTLRLTPASLFLRRGLRAAASEFTPGETVLLRQRRGTGGQAQVVLLCDPESAAAIDKYRHQPLRGTLLSATAGTLVVQPEGDADDVPLTLRLSPRTIYSASGVPVAPSAFGTGAQVTVTTRGLADGLLLAISVMDAPTAAPPSEDKPRRAASVSGLVTDVQPDTGMLTVEDNAGASRVLAVDTRTRVEVRKQSAHLTDVVAGMHVSAWLGAEQDALGNPIATRVSATEATRRKKKVL